MKRYTWRFLCKRQPIPWSLLHLVHYPPNFTQSTVLFRNPWPLPKPLSPSPQLLVTQMLPNLPNDSGTEASPSSKTRVCHHFSWLQCRWWWPSNSLASQTLIFRHHSTSAGPGTASSVATLSPKPSTLVHLELITGILKNTKPIHFLIPSALLFVLTVSSNSSLLPAHI